MAGFDDPGSVDTPAVMAGFEVFLGGRPRPRTAIPAACRYTLAVSRRTEVASSIRLSDQPSRPNQNLLSLVVAQDVAHPGGGSPPTRLSQRLGPSLLMAGFQMSINGRIWVSAEAAGSPMSRTTTGCT